MKDIHFYLLHGVSQIVGRYVPKSLVDLGSVCDSQYEFVSALTRKMHLSKTVDANFVMDQVFRNLQFHRDLGYEVLTPLSSNWPENLRHIPDPPHMLFTRGVFAIRPRIAIIGSRCATKDAKTEASDLGLGFAKEGFEILCGGAFGCDIASKLKVIQSPYSHLGTVVLPGGLLRPYPLAHLRYFDSLADSGGLIVSEKFIDHVPSPGDFIARNRIIAALADVVILIQGDERSGSSTTIKFALGYGKEIYVSAVAESDSPLSKRLLAEGARSIHSLQLDFLH